MCIVFPNSGVDRAFANAFEQFNTELSYGKPACAYQRHFLFSLPVKEGFVI